MHSTKLFCWEVWGIHDEQSHEFVASALSEIKQLKSKVGGIGDGNLREVIMEAVRSSF